MTPNTIFLKSPLMNNVVLLSSILICFFFILIGTYAQLTFGSTEISNNVGTIRLNQDLFEVSAGSSELVKISGLVPSANRGDRVAIIFTMPDAETEGSLVFPTDDGLFETFLMLDDNSQLGTYTVFASFNSSPIGTLTFSVTQKQFSIKEDIIPSSPAPKIFNEFTFTTNKNSYSDGEKIIISGHVDEVLSQTPITLKIISPTGNLVAIAQIKVDVDGTFNTTVMSGGSTWMSTGTYVINALYGSNSKTIESTFYFDATNTNTISQTSNLPINIEGHEVDVQITSGYVTNIIPDVDANALIISVDTTNDGLLTLKVPRSVLDATTNGQDDKFFILVDGVEVDFDEITSSKDRTLTIALPAGADEIEIIGTQILHPITPPKIIYHDTNLSLQLTDGTSQGYAKVKPTLTYGSGNALTSDVSIYVDGTYKTKVTSNQWSSNIYTGSGSHTIKASITELTDTVNTSIKYRASSDTENYLGKVTPTPTPVQRSTPTPTTTPSGDFPIGYVIAIIVIVAIAAGVGITLSKRKKIAPVIYAKPANIQTVSDETQFWVCPHCGQDTEYRNQKQFCGRCNTYL